MDYLLSLITCIITPLYLWVKRWIENSTIKIEDNNTIALEINVKNIIDSH